MKQTSPAKRKMATTARRASEVGQVPDLPTDCFALSKQNQLPARPFSREGMASAVPQNAATMGL
jgi:hypothetical protein